MSKLEVNAVEPQCGTNLTLGASGDTIIIPSGATISNQGTAAGFGPTGAVSWDTTKITADPNPAVTGVGYFADTTSAAFTITLPATPSAGAVVGIADYANTFATNNLTIDRNGSNIGGVAENAFLTTNGVSVTLVYVDATQGWIVTDSGNRADLPTPEYIVATGGTITCDGDYKIHTFTGPGTFTVTSVGNPFGSTTVDYLVVAGGGGAGGGDGTHGGGGAGAGGFRYSNSTFSVSGAPGAPLASATGLPVTATGYPITVGAGAAGGSACTVNRGSNSVFSTITSTGGGGGGNDDRNTPGSLAIPGGSGGGSGVDSFSRPAGTGNTPPTSPPQGNTGGFSNPTPTGGLGGAGGGGGAMALGINGGLPTSANGQGGAGGVGAGLPTAFGSNGVPSGGYQYFSGGGGGGSHQCVTSANAAGGLGGGGASNNSGGVTGTTNTGGGGGSTPISSPGASGGSGIVVIRYKYQ
jgi:hypothetical protein